MTAFLGCVTGKINTHNFSFIAEAKVKKFQYIKLYHEEMGFVLAQIVELISEENEIKAECEIIGCRDSRGLLRIPNSTVNHKSEVYNADSEFIKSVIGLDKTDGLYIGLLEEYSMIRVCLDVKKLITKHLAVLAKTGAGKSYTLGVIVEELISKGVPCVIIDPHGEYSSLKNPNTNDDDLKLMHRYDVKPEGFRDKVVEFSPNTKINPDAKPFSISINSLSAQEIANLTPIKLAGTQLGILYNVISEVKDKNDNYDLEDIRSGLENVNSSAKYGIYACIDFLENIKVFSDEPVNAENLVIPGKVSLLNFRGVPPEVQQIIAAKLCNDLFEKRKKNNIPPFFLIVEEAHNFCPERNFGESPSSYILRNIASEGRKFGLGLGIVSQRPARVDKNVLSQCNTQIIQKVTNPNDLKAISASAENINSFVVNDIATLPIGTALIIGACAKPIFVDVRVRKSEHGGKSVSFDYDKIPAMVVENPEIIEKIEGVPVQVLRIGKYSSPAPFFLAEAEENGAVFNLLVRDEDCAILDNDLNSVTTAAQSINGLGASARNVLNVLNSRSPASVSYLFNALNCSFQDLNYWIKELQNKQLVKVDGSSVSLKNNFAFKNSAFSKNFSENIIGEALLPSFRNDEKIVADSLKAKGLNVNSVSRVYVQ